ncbi:VanZ family protein [Companilactobacillus allii]|nr:VanZ family protein [Companilactobacillus allii]
MQNKLKMKQKWFWGVVIAIELILFYSSSMTYKEQTSVPFLEKILGTNKPLYSSLSKISFRYGGKTQSIENDGYFHFLEFFIRKGAHFSIYFLLGLFLCLAVYKYFSKNKFLMMFIPWLATTGLAAFDEFHQGLTGGRTPSVTDVILDSVGALTGILVLMLILWLIELHANKNKS